jgi:HlyD family secretion protein
MNEQIADHIFVKKVFFENKSLQNNIGHRSEMANEIISHKPDFIEKWALFIFMLILLILIVSTWFISYPDIIESQATLTAANAPKEIVIRQDGRLVKLAKHNNEKVSKGEIFGWIESTASHEEVLALSQQVDNSVWLLNSGQGRKASSLFNKHYNNLGEVQQGYQSFIVALQLYNDYKVNGFFSRKKNMLQDDIQSLKSTNQTLQLQKKLVEQDMKLAEESFNMNQKLSDEKVLSKEEFRQEKSKFVNKQMTIPQIQASLISNHTQVREKEKEIDQLNHDSEQQLVILQQALLSLKSTIDDWKKNIYCKTRMKEIFFLLLQ